VHNSDASGNSSSPSTATLLSAIRGADSQISESLWRKHVARNRSDVGAWRILIGYIEQNENAREAVRIAEAMLAEFPSSPDVTSFVGAVLATHAAFDRAHALLRLNEMSLDLPGLLTLAQLTLMKDHDRARGLFEKIVATHGDVLEAHLGIANAETLERGQGAPVGFFLFSDWHRSIQQSVFNAYRTRRLPAFMTTTPWLVRALAPNVLVVSDTPGLSKIRWQIPGIRIVHTRHGIGDKNYGYFAAGAADFVCVTSEAVAEEYVRSGLFERERFWVTGFPQLDSFFARTKAGHKQREPKTVLFAPTFNEGLSAGLKLGADAIACIRGQDSSIRVIIRPHPHMRVTAPALLNQWRAQSLLMPNVEINDDPNADLGALMLRSAAMVSDVSSIALSYVALDRPLVCVDVEGEARASPNYAPEAVEWRMLKAAHRATRETLAGVVAAALADPKGMSAERRELRAHLFGELTDGRAGERIAKRIAGLIDA